MKTWVDVWLVPAAMFGSMALRCGVPLTANTGPGKYCGGIQDGDEC